MVWIIYRIFANVMKKENELQSPDQIGEHLRVTAVPTYLLATAAFVLLAAFIVWGFLGNVSDKAYYSGVVFPVQGTTDITLPNKGIVRTMLVHNGDSVRQGQTVAMVSIGDSHSFLTSTVSGLVISTKSDNEPFEAFDPIVSVIDGTGTSQHIAQTQLIAYADMVTPISYPDDRHQAQITAISPVVEKSGMVHLEATLTPHPHLMPGMSAIVTLE